MLYQPKAFTFVAPPRIVAGPGVSLRAGEELEMLGVETVMLVSDHGLRGNWAPGWRARAVG